MDIKSLRTQLALLRAQIEVAASEGIAEGAELVAKEARDWIGVEHSSWPKLADSTLREKERLQSQGKINVALPAPLLRYGDLKNSIKVEQIGLHAEIGSDDPKAPTHEHGGMTPQGAIVLPRPFLQPALTTKADEVIMLIEQRVADALKKVR